MVPTHLFHSHSVLLLRIPLLQSLNTIAEQWHTHLLAHTPAKCSTHPRIGSSRVDAAAPLRGLTQQVTLRMRNRNFGASNGPIKGHRDSSSNQKFELSRLLPFAVLVTHVPDGQTDTHKKINRREDLKFISEIP